MSRSDSSLQNPDPSRDYTEFPTYNHRARVCRYRAHQGRYNPWYFASGIGRFNLAAPRGTLNTASSPEVAVREYLGRVLVGHPEIPQTAVAGMGVSELEIPQVKAADFLAEEAIAFGIVSADVVAPMPDNYATTRAWAAALCDAGFGGIQARSRFGGGDNPTCLFVFGYSGEHVLGDINHTQMMHEVVSSMVGFRIVPTPSSETLQIDKD